MAGPTVKLTFAGDSSNLDRAFDNVGDSSQRMADDVGDATGRARDAGGGLSDLGERADGTETRMQGLSDVISGTGDTMTAFKEGDVAGMASGLADLGGGIAGFVVPAISGLAGTLGGPLRTAMTFISSHPLLIAIGLLVAVFVLLWTTSDGFRKFITDKLGAAFTWVQGVIGDAAGWAKKKWDELIDFFEGLPRKIGGIFDRVGSAIKGAFKAAFNAVADLWNGTIGKISFTIPNWVPFGLGGNSFSVPDIPRMHGGGIVPGNQGSEMLAILQAGERVTPRGQVGNGALELRVASGADSALAALLMQMVRTGQLQLVAA